MSFVFLQIVQVVVFCFGLRSCYSAIKHAHFFYHSKERIGGSMVRMLIEQCVSSIGTLLFASNSLVEMLIGGEQGSWNNVNPYVANTIRIIMFSAMIHSTNHLSASVREIIEKHEKEKPRQ